MNVLHYRGDTSGAGTSFRSAVTGNMKTLLRRWINSRSARTLKSIHLHIDDPSIVISKKASEQSRRDAYRTTSRETGAGRDADDYVIINRIGFDEELCVPGNSLLVDRIYKDELASLHLFCACQAAREMVSETGGTCAVYLHWRNFSAPSSLKSCSANALTPLQQRPTQI